MKTEVETKIKPGMLVRWRDWREVPGRRTGLVIDVDTRPPMNWPDDRSVTLIWSGETKLSKTFLRFLEPFTDELNA